ncbi:MAG: PEP-CTERM sorting domain-containing protein, partial [Kiritimatiellae bacterium]|nr:PEP-CTERM sorting domain-containing protein [Kiritimatiellia bacterium]
NATGMDVGEAQLAFDISSTTLKDIDTTGTGAGWYMTKAASPVPEPTSGLLMLLGVAGLALRRKRA